ncbi:MAG: L,D-transpeptidase family protein [Candidatus Omnitrophota bacterium]
MKKVAIILIIIILSAGIAILFLNKKSNKLPRLEPLAPQEAPVSDLLAKAKELQEKGKLQELRDVYQKVISIYPNSHEIANWQKKLEELNIRILFSPIITPKNVSYEIKKGDTLTRIAKEFKTTVELIKKSNNIASDTIYPGRKIKVWVAPFSILVDKSQNTLVLKSENEIVKSYIVATGVNNSTPIGNYRIVNKIPNPTWYKAGAVVPPGSPDNVLGSFWMGFDLAGYGIHGTVDPQSLGTQITQGCVRMSNKDVEELYIIVGTGTQVTIVD